MTINDVETLEYCKSMKNEYYKRCVKMLYKLPYMGSDEIKKHLDALGLNDRLDAIEWLLMHKNSLSVEISIKTSILMQERIETNMRDKILEFLKTALIVCNKAQAIRIMFAISISSKDIEHELSSIETF